ncbi:uncharacterized protein KQ657_001088 [Scheffersomyces spartinae]|uniref:Short chain dehydrogenase n=1 Tax=Scheffersomyces spartinae TaxID=45513 RepID=A0A9P7V886_9ASCO|nr:uncharacterized protein KQ657_001088 [Scheffersomyces spartinae]KAG7192978.1 hypothetical protein KQ657_001088 [Scheffersomyces spartinae]
MSFLSKVSLKGKSSIITGGTKNLGALTAREFAALGSDLILHYHSQSGTPEAEKLKKELESEYGIQVFLFAGDLKHQKANEDLFKFAIDKFGKVDVAVNNVGMVMKKPQVEFTEEEFETMDDRNNKAAFFFIQAASKYVAEGGRIISIVTSLLAAYTPNYGVYQGTKAPVEYYSKAASKELHGKQIAVNCVAPGPMDTPFFYGQETKESVEFCKSCGMGNRLTKIDDIVPILRFLATEGGWITGQTIFASGGFTAH